ncbi:hypothetical protein AGR7C_Lc100173 [Agrobacterium deltaense Zutra 3/1]|uniref:Uncharacterized protein n=1 Tax=Agrobacterium deltaense Zutra 3/1 TaxID=1183427 RepID=A0A1S7QT51_9HYPH|nr:hypothetical protein AGR7C_Lc100173 [Agrobacterium deltaense Zutra 3/1]
MIGAPNQLTRVYRTLILGPYQPETRH